MPVELISIILTGYCFEIIGRSQLIYFSFTIAGISIFLFPIVSPSNVLYIISTMIWTIAIQPLILNHNPLIMDYVCQDSRGRAMALTIMGTSFGTLCSFLVL